MSVDDAEPFRHDLEVLLLDVPRPILGIQRMQRDLRVGPLILTRLPLGAGVSLDRIAVGLVQYTTSLHEHDLALPGSLRVEPEQIQAAVRNAGLHRPAHHMRNEEIASHPRTFGSRDPILYERLHILTEIAGSGAERV